MKRINRLRKNKDFKFVISKHHSIKSNEFVIYYNKNNEDHTRIGISVSKKLGNAIVRNKIKRQIKDILRQIVNLDNKLDIVIVAKEGFLLNSYKDNFNKLEKIIKEIQ